MRNQSVGPLSSVDNALQVVEMLATRPSLRVIEVSEELSVARSTAHRILAALMARGFVVQDAHKVYRPGPTLQRLRQPELHGRRISLEIMHPHLERLATLLGETCHVAVLEGSSTRFIDGVESHRTLRIGTRTGMLLPAHKTAIGLVLLAELPFSSLRAMYPRGLTGDAKEARLTLETLDRKIRAARRTGYARNIGESDAGISAVATCLRDPSGRAIAGLAVAIPTPRFDDYSLADLKRELNETAEAFKADLASMSPDISD
ncbi:DNA-binding IclR family transcriptional regulator [Rhodococcus sp. 27YEA15]|uniref:IclR family transcriptional regulator n=1 Tax=Rhodococcus sp. 27YEA15 TaxID=3156259 RepID=UPI003C7AB2E3